MLAASAGHLPVIVIPLEDIHLLKGRQTPIRDSVSKYLGIYIELGED